MPIAPSATVRHVVAWKRCKPFPENATVQVISTHNPWRPNSLGWPLFENVLRKKTTTTVGQILRDASDIGFDPFNTMQHLRWLYTWGDFIEIDGQRYFPAKEEVPLQPGEVKAPVVKKAKKREKV
jgi:hypothetical protein